MQTHREIGALREHVRLLAVENPWEQVGVAALRDFDLVFQVGNDEPMEPIDTLAPSTIRRWFSGKDTRHASPLAEFEGPRANRIHHWDSRRWAARLLALATFSQMCLGTIRR